MLPVKWITDYCKRAGDEFIVLGGDVAVSEHGFCTYEIDKHEAVLFVHNCYGNGKHWERFLKNKAREFGCKKIRFATKRNPKAFERRFKAKVIGYIMEMEVD